MNFKWILAGLVPLNFAAASCGTAHEVASAGAAGVRVETVQAAGHSYIVMHAQPGAEVRTSVTRPDTADAGVLLSVAGAFTGEDLVSVCGDHVVAGKLLPGYDDVTLTCHLLSVGGKVSILPQSELQRSIGAAVAGQGYLLQQCYIVEHGVGHTERIPQAIRDRKACIIYRAACVMADGSFAVIQGADNQLPGEFVAGLVAVGAREALYLDMGSWAYGWWRSTPGAPIHELSPHYDNTRHQSNWLIICAQ